MQFTLKALFDDETKKQIRDGVLGEAKTVARNEIDIAIKGEVQRLAKESVSRMTDTKSPDWRLRNFFTEVVKNMLASHWEDLGKQFRDMVRDAVTNELEGQIEKAVAKAADAEVKAKLKNKTVWEAASQEAYIRKVVRQELVNSLSLVKGQDL